MTSFLCGRNRSAKAATLEEEMSTDAGKAHSWHVQGEFGLGYPPIQFLTGEVTSLQDRGDLKSFM